MGNLCSCKRRPKKKIVLLLVGLDNAGKTVAAKGLAGETDAIDTVPTVGFSVVNLTYLNYSVKVYDLGGGPNIRGIWHKYFVDAYGIIFVVDSTDLTRLDEAREVLRDLLSHDKVARKPVLVLANKQDSELALDEIDIIEKLDLESIVNGNECPTLVESCAAFSASSNSKIDPGIKRGYEWLLSYILRHYDTLNGRVEADVAEETALEDRLRQEKIAKIRRRKQIEQQQLLDDDVIESYSNYKRKVNGSVAQEPIGNPLSDTSASSSSSSHTVYYVKEESKKDRPKSAVQLVREQLILNNPGKTALFVSRASNKTYPLQLYGPERHGVNNKRPFSAGNPRRTADRRHLRSAGDAPMRLADLPNVPLSKGDEFHSEILDLMNFPGNSDKLTPAGDAPNQKPTFLNGRANGFTIVDINL